MLRFGLINLKFRRSTMFLYAIVSIFSLPSRLLDGSSDPSFVLFALAIGVVVTALVLPLLYVACSINSRYHLGEKSIVYPIVIIAAIGAIRALIMQGVLSVVDLEDGLATVSGIFSSTIFTLIYFVGISSFMELLIQKRESFNQIFNQSTALLSQSKTDLIGHSSEQTYINTVDAVKTSVNENLNSKTESGLIDAKSASLEIQRLINEVLRPLSHRLWVNSLGQIKHTNLISIIKDAIADLDFSPRVLLIYQLTVGGFGIALVLGVQTSIYLSIVAALTSAAVIFLFYRLKPRVTKHPLAAGITFLFSIGLLPVLVPIAIRSEILTSPYLFLGLTISPTLPGLIVLVSAYRLISRDRDLAVSAAASVSWQIASNAYLPKNEVAKTEELAEYFHNYLQSELLRIAKKLEHLDFNEGQEETKALLKSLDVALDRGYNDAMPKESDGLIRIEKLVESWKGMCAISISGLNLLESKSQLAFKVSTLAEELTTNSVRYGEASEIEISLTLDGDQLQILLTHNGKQEVQSKHGLGTLLIGRYSREGVITQVENGKTSYKITLP